MLVSSAGAGVAETTAAATATRAPSESTVTMIDSHQASHPQCTSRPRSVRSAESSATRRQRIELARARVELAAAKVTLLEEEVDSQDEDSLPCNEQRTEAWVQVHSKEAERRCKEYAYQEPWAAPPQRYESNRSSVDIAELAAAITLAARGTRAAPELPIFNGSSADWLPFKAAYAQTVKQVSEEENVARLRRSLRGAAKEAVQCLFLGETSAWEVMKLLESRFGRPDALVLAELDKLRNLPRLTENPRDVCIYASKVANITATIRALKKPQYLYNPELVRGIVEKFPSTIRYRYYDFASDNNDEVPDLVKLTKFLEITADRCGNFAPAENIRSEDRREQTSAANNRRPQRTYHNEDAPAPNSRSAPTPTPPATQQSQACEICGNRHRADECEKMKRAEVPARWDMARKYKLCFRCLRVRRYKHTCKSKKCEIGGCTYWHHPLLHGESAPSTRREDTVHCIDTPVDAVVASAIEKDRTSALLKILPVRVAGPKGATDTFALLDDGSTCTLIDAALAEKIGVEGTPEPFFIEGVAGARIDAGQSQRVRLTISGRDTSSFKITARTMTDLRLSSQSVSADTVKRCSHLKGIEDRLTYTHAKPSILVGQDNWHLLLSRDVRRGRRNQPVASLTELGWVLHGTRQARQGKTQRVHHVTARRDADDEMERLMKEHFALESLGVEPRRSYNDEERRALSILEATTNRLPAGGFETGLLWRSDDFTPPDNYDATLRRLESVERKLDRDSEMKKRYAAQVQVLLENDYAEVAPTARPKRAWYLPHFAVINPAKPEKLRIVHDAAAKTKGTSLNDMLLSGPDMLQSLPGVLMRYRQRRVAVTADIKDMFMRVEMREEDRDMQRFLWRDDRRSGAPTEYRMKAVIFGATSSPCTAIYVKNRNAEDFKTRYPEAAAAVVSNHYMDDYLDSHDTEEEAIRIAHQVAYIHSRANFFLQRWASNSRRVRAELAPGSENRIVHLDPEKILGMVWDPERDTLSFNVNERKIPTEILNGGRIPTKREALRTAMSIYDPLGLATPITIQAKRILQDTWRSGIGWDDTLEGAEAKAWADWIRRASHLTEIAVPRCYPLLTSARYIEVHTFVDASSSAYTAATYWRTIREDGTVHVSLVAGKGKVAPLKTVSIPRLELQAAVLGCRLTQTVIEEHDIKPTRRVYWSDSRTVLAWIRNGPRAYKPYVAHRVAEIAETTKTVEWKWVPTKENVADDATRDIPRDFNSEHRWYCGPAFLYRREDSWPTEDEDTITDDTGEERVNVVVAATRLTEALPDIARFANWMRVIRATARVFQFVERLKNKQRCGATHSRTKRNNESDPTWTGTRTEARPATTRDVRRRRAIPLVPIEARHLHRAQLTWVRAQQEELFASELEAVRRGAPFPSSSRLALLAASIDEEDGLLKLRSRVAAAANVTTAQIRPPIIDGGHPWTRLYIAWVHSRLHHGGFETTANEVRQEYWVLRLRYAVRTVVKQCQLCRVRRATPARPSTGDHPASRVAHHQRPFTYTGLDYFGPLTVTVGRTRQKRYGVLFTCLTTRAVHIELAGSLTTDSAVMALRRFIGRRGCPTEMWSDQGTNLRGADLELKKATDEAMQNEASVKLIRWRFIPPSAPFMGGAWERLVRSVKSALQVTLHERAPKEEILTTLLVEAEHTINSRPLTHVSTSPDDEEALTPNHFLMGGPSRVPHPGTFDNEDLAGRKEWRTSQRLADMFWSRWVREYLPELQRRRDPRARGEIKPFDLVLIADGTLPRNCWPRGIVQAVYPGPDGEIRVVDVRTKKGILRRPTKKLVILPTTPEP